MSRIFLIGSGPSLKVTPVDDLIGEDVMVMNKFGFMAKQHGWKIKPKYYFKIDHNTIDQTHIEEIMWGAENCKKLFLWEQFRTGYKVGHGNYEDMKTGVGNLPNVQWLKKCEHTPYQWDNWKAVQSWHLPRFCTAFGGMSVMLQIASMEYDEIYLLGCDLGYTPTMSLNHAIPDYTKDLRDKSEMDNGNMLYLHNMAKRCSPVPIYNATIGGFLEVYPRVDLMELLHGKKEAVYNSPKKRKSDDGRAKNRKASSKVRKTNRKVDQ